jgi:hypothetical protein
VLRTLQAALRLVATERKSLRMNAYP